MATKLVKGNSWSPALRREPIVQLLVNLFFVIAIPLLDFAFELIAAAVDDIQIVVGQFAPLLLHFASYLFPISFNAVPVHLDLHSDVTPCLRSVQ